MDYKYLIIPDIHGRKFWKEPLEKFSGKVEHIIFIGDYFDPYPIEGISEKDGINNWHELVECIKPLQDRTTMLIGNHDAHYMNQLYDSLARSTRKSEWYDKEIGALLNDCHGLQVAYDGEAGGRKILFTHAGVNADWYNRHKDLISNLCAANLNKLTATDEGWKALAEIGRTRWGSSPTGSPLWADISEHDSSPLPTASQGGYDFQVFGHTRKDSPIMEDRFAMLDSRQCFVMTAEGEILSTNGL